MIVEAPLQLKIWYNHLERDHRRTLIKYIGVLTELTNMNGWSQRIEFLTWYWDNERMVFQFRTMDITPTIEDIETTTTQWIQGWREE